MKSRVRFHLGEGPHKGHWQVRRGRAVEYYDPSEVSLSLRGCRLVNRRATARRIYHGEHKTPCAWIECEGVEARPSKRPVGATEVRFNPRIAPHWIFGGENADGMAFASLTTIGRRVLAKGDAKAYVDDEAQCLLSESEMERTVQTFLPYDNYIDSARCLDYRRLGKQRVECKQLLQALGVPVGGPLPAKPSSWRNHPAARMWQGHEYCLAIYGIAVCMEWRRRGYRDTLLPQLEDAAWHVLRHGGDSGPPSWLGDEDFHRSHRSNLTRKLPEHYSQFGWSEPNNLPYVWPVGTAVAVS